MTRNDPAIGCYINSFDVTIANITCKTAKVVSSKPGANGPSQPHDPNSPAEKLNKLPTYPPIASNSLDVSKGELVFVVGCKGSRTSTCGFVKDELSSEYCIMSRHFFLSEMIRMVMAILLSLLLLWCYC